MKLWTIVWQMVLFFGVWIQLYLSIIGCVTYIIPYLNNKPSIPASDWFFCPALIPFIYFGSVFAIVVAGGELDKIAAAEANNPNSKNKDA